MNWVGYILTFILGWIFGFCSVLFVGAMSIAEKKIKEEEK